MKTKIAIITALSASIAMCEEPDTYWDDVSALPLLAGVCDIIGIGELESQTSTNAIIHVSQYWFGDPQTNIIDAYVVENELLPSGGTNFLFFLSNRSMIGELEPARLRYAWMFGMECFRNEYQPDMKPYLLGGIRSWVPVTEDNAAMINWCSNLVQSAQINTNILAFYELIRDGYRFNPPSSRVHRDSEHSFMWAGYYMSTNFMQQVWSDTNLTGWARSGIDNAYRQKTGVLMPWPSSE